MIGTIRKCPAQLLIFNLENNYLLERIKIPDDIAQSRNGTGLLVNPAVFYETADQYCQDPKVVYQFLFKSQKTNIIKYK